MNIICLVVFGIAGAFCYDAPVGYTPPGNCEHVDDTLTCYMEPEELEIRASWYNPEIGYDKEWDTNCMKPCHVLGDGTEVSSGYGLYMACPAEWYNVEIFFKSLGISRTCRDSGSAIVPTCREVFIPEKGREYTCFITIDFLEQEQPWFAYLLLDWSATWQKSSTKDETDEHDRLLKTK